MSSQLPKISIIIPVRNEERHLEKAVESVVAQQYLGATEIILAIGPSVDKTMEVAESLKKRFPNLVVLENPKGLTTTGLNLAIAASSGSVIVRVDAHSELGEGYLAKGVEILERTDSVLLGGIMRARGKTPLQKAVAYGYSSRLGLGGGSYHLGGKEGEAESAYLGIFRAEALKAVGGYDEKIIRGEDWDLAQRLRAAGGKVYFSPELVVDYWPRSNLQALAWQFYSTGVWRGELTRRAPSKASLRYFIPPIALLVLADLIFLSVSGYVDYRLVIIPIASYLALLALGAATARNLGLLDRAAVLIALPVMHLSWASGFWVGLAFGAGKIVDSGKRR